MISDVDNKILLKEDLGEEMYYNYLITGVVSNKPTICYYSLNKAAQYFTRKTTDNLKYEPATIKRKLI